MASEKRAGEVAAYLDGEGLTAERGRLRSPAGLDIGARKGDEIALSIVAEIVRERRVYESMESVPEPPADSVASAGAPTDSTQYPQITCWNEVLPLVSSRGHGKTASVRSETVARA